VIFASFEAFVFVVSGSRVARTTRRTPKVTRRPAWSKTCTRLLFREVPWLVQKAASRICLRRCLRILTNISALQLPDRDPFVLFPGNPSASCVRNARWIFLRRDTAHRSRIYFRIPGPAKLTRLLATCAASENLDPHHGRVKQFVMRSQKNFARERSLYGHAP
jgi:hypothetical protein